MSEDLVVRIAEKWFPKLIGSSENEREQANCESAIREAREEIARELEKVMFPSCRKTCECAADMKSMAIRIIRGQTNE